MVKIRPCGYGDDNPRPTKKQSTMLLTKLEFPHHLIFDALLHRLPIKSLVRFRSVSKSWDSFIRDPSFVQLRRTAGNINDHLVFVSPDPRADKIGTSNPQVFSTPLHLNNEENQATCSSPAIPTHILTISNFFYCDYDVQSVNGFLCFRHMNGILLRDLKNDILTQIANPTTRQLITLPCDDTLSIPREAYLATHFGFDPLRDEFKVLRFYQYKTWYEFKILTVGSDSSWRRINPITSFNPLYCNFIVSGRGYYFNGAIYWMDETHRIVAFDVGNERFRTICINECKCSMYNAKFVEVEGCLTVLGYGFYRNPKYLWILKNYEANLWIHECIDELPLELESESLHKMIPLCGVGNSEIMLLPHVVSKRVRVYYYDLMNRTIVGSKVIMEMPQPLWPRMHTGEPDMFFIQESFKVLKL